MRFVALILLSFSFSVCLYSRQVEFGGILFRVTGKPAPQEVQYEMVEVYRLLTYFDGTSEYIAEKTSLSNEDRDKLLKQKMDAYERYNGLGNAYRSEHVRMSFDLLSKFYVNKEKMSRVQRDARFQKEEREEALFVSSVIVSYFHGRSLERQMSYRDGYWNSFNRPRLFYSLQMIDSEVLLHLKRSDFGQGISGYKEGAHLVFPHNFTLLNVLIEYAAAFDRFPEHVLELLGSQREHFERYGALLDDQRSVLMQIDATRKAYVAQMRQLFDEARFTEFLVLLRFYEALYPASVSVLSREFDANLLFLDTLAFYEGVITRLAAVLEHDEHLEDGVELLGTHMYHIQSK